MRLRRNSVEIAAVAAVVVATAIGALAVSRRRTERPVAEPQPPEPASLVWEG